MKAAAATLRFAIYYGPRWALQHIGANLMSVECHVTFLALAVTPGA